MDIHPGCSVGKGVMIDHATGVVFGETAVVGDDCTFLHGVTLGGTGKSRGDRHPKLGCGILVGAGSMILGNITIGDRCKVSTIMGLLFVQELQAAAGSLLYAEVTCCPAWCVFLRACFHFFCRLLLLAHPL